MGSYKHIAKKGCQDELRGDQAKSMIGGRPPVAPVATRGDNLDVIQQVGEEDMDAVMQAMCEHLGLQKPRRDYGETGACESTDCRQLGKKDLILRRIPFYILNWRGQMEQKKYGKDQSWKVLPYHQDQLIQEAPLSSVSTIEYLPTDNILGFLAMAFGSELESRVNRSSVGEVYHNSYINHTVRKESMVQHYSHHTLFGYERLYFDQTVEIHNIQEEKMKVLPQAVFSVPLSKCISFDSVKSGGVLIEYMRKIPFCLNKRLACSIHIQDQASSLDGQLSFFDPHKDKAYFDHVVFIPLKGEFWTFVAIPKIQFASFLDNNPVLVESDAKFDAFMKNATPEDSRKVQTYMTLACEMATADYSCDFKLQPFLCKPGTALKFPAAKLIHFTVSKGCSGMRDLMILHPFEKYG